MRAYFGGNLVLRRLGAFLRANDESIAVTFYDAEEGGTRYTDLALDEAGTLPVTSYTATGATTDGPWGPPGVLWMWADSGDGKRELVRGVFSEAGLSATYVGLGPAATGTAATDTVNLQAVLTASATTRQRLPKGAYVINATLTIPTGADVDFGGATIQRATGSVFDMLANADGVAGNSGITLRNLTIDGNKAADGRVAENVGDRFGGLVLVKVTDSLLDNVTVKGTVNNELTAGVYFDQCTDIYARNLNGWNNDRTAILLSASSRITIDGSLTYDNLGSGISSTLSPECACLNITSHDNGYSNLSVNGVRSRISHVLSYGAGMSGVNIGHLNDAADTVGTNIVSYGNTYEGISVSSSRINISNFEVHGNARNNIRTMTGAVACRFTNGVVRDSAGGQGVFFETGAGHSVAFCDVFGNAVSGINVPAAAPSVEIGPGVRVFNNGKVTSANSAGVLLNTTTNARLIGVECYDDQGTKTQESGVWLAGGSGHVLVGNRVEGNKTNQVRVSSSPQYVMYEGSGATGVARITGTSFIMSAGSLGFYGVAPVARAAVAAAATDAATTQTLANDLRAKLIALGLVQ